ncbi:MAG: glutamine--fructose-6-phosphate transaminase (isomerizing) [Armatimonadetes bacterium]|nr:glutamine--fructose-6-phosphate transaminase (isomerizing) [Armatimonadota bacterium]
MCGITGYIGSRDAVRTAVQSLHQLEYRGYDSAGVASAAGGSIRVLKATGKIAALDALIEGAAVTSGAAVAHTRWATHGRPNEANAHPHQDCLGRLAVVHNGIIENYAELRHALRRRGHEFASETDTEVLAHLLEERLKASPTADDLLAAVRGAAAEVTGSYAMAVVCRDLPDTIVVARQDSPLVIGLGEGENFLASDIPALLPYTRSVLVLEDGDVAEIGSNRVRITDAAGRDVERKPMQVTWDASAAEKGGFAHFMLKEIHEGPTAVRETLRGRLMPDGAVELSDVAITPEQWSHVRRVIIVGCGTAYHAGLVAKRLMEQLLRRPVDAAFASEFRYSDPIVGAGDLALFISQSGETADTLAALREAKRRGALTLAVVNAVGSTLSREADAVLYTRAGPEIGVASTKAYLAQVAALACLALFLGRNAEAAADARMALARSLAALPEALAICLDRSGEVATVARALGAHSCFFYLGRGYDFAAATEAALKLKEISYIHAEAYAAGEMKHGPLALVEPGVAVVGLCTQSATHEKMLSNLREVKAREGTVVALIHDGREAPPEVDFLLRIPETHPALTAIPALCTLQLLAYHVALARGCDIDQPRNLAKSVTVE